MMHTSFLFYPKVSGGKGQDTEQQLYHPGEPLLLSAGMERFPVFWKQDSVHGLRGINGRQRSWLRRNPICGDL